MSDTSRVWLITGISRGIGLELVRQLATSPNNTVIATCRSPASATTMAELSVSAKGTVHVVALETDDRQSVHASVPEGTVKTIVNVSSTLGSMGRELGELYASYSISKAGLNMLTYKQCRDGPDLTVISMCPGHLKTEGGGEGAKLEVSVGDEGVLKVIKSLTPKDSGKFFRHSGEEVPW